MTNRRGCGWPQALLFDLDGTLIDSAPDIAAAINTVMAEDNLPELRVDRVRNMIGNGVGKLVERAYRANGMPLLGEVLDQAITKMMDAYGNGLTNETIVFPGAREIMAQYAAVGVKTAIVSNKPHDFCKEIADTYGFGEHLSVVQGAQDHLPKKPAPDMLFAAMEKMDVDAQNSVFVGDSAADVEAARNAKIPVIVIHGGYSKTPGEKLGADAVVNALEDLPSGIEQLKQIFF